MGNQHVIEINGQRHQSPVWFTPPSSGEDEVLGKCMGIGVRAFSVNKMKGTSLVKPKFAKEKDQEKER